MFFNRKEVLRKNRSTVPSDNCLVEASEVGGREVRGAITNDFIAVTLDGGLRVPFRGSRAGEIRGMTGRIPLFAWEEAFPLEKIRDTRRRSGTYLARTHRPIGGRPPDVSIFNRPHDTLRLNVHVRTTSDLGLEGESNFDRELKYFIFQFISKTS